MKPCKKFKNFSDVIQKHVQEIPDNRIFTFLGEKGRELENCTVLKLHEKAMTIAGFLKDKVRPGDRALLIYKTEPEFIHAFLGCLYAGVIAVPVYPPKPGDGDNKLKHIIADASPAVSLTSSSLFSDLTNPARKVAYQGPMLINTEEITDSWKDNYTVFSPDLKDIAFLQYTSGSTGEPRGVIVSHESLLADEEMIKQYFGHSEKTVVAGWTPVYHDMGLVGNILQPIYIGRPFILMSTLTFLRDPISWLRMISKYKATTSGGPNFAYELCIQRATEDVIEKLDLSSWDLAFCGGEPNRAGTLDFFSEVFKPCGFKKKSFYPCWGLAESCLFVMGGRKDEHPVEITVQKEAFNENRIVISDDILEDRKTIVGIGSNRGGQRIEVVDPEERIVMGENQIGEIWVQSPSVNPGYWKNSRETEVVFNARLKSGEGPFLRTGDLGFINNKEVFIAGRLKDVIIVNGRNYYPQDIELTVENNSDGIRQGRIAAFQVPDDNEDKLCIIAEYTGNKEITSDVIDDIRYAVSREHKLKAHIIGLVKRKQVPITTSGKIRRNAAKKAYLENRFNIIDLSDISTGFYNSDISGEACDNDRDDNRPDFGKESLSDLIRSIVAEKLRLAPEEIDTSAPLGQYGLSSHDAVELIVEFEILTGESFAPTIIFEYPTVDELSEFLNGKLEGETGQNINQSFGSNDIAVIGMSCCFPGSPGPDEFWKNLVAETDLVSSVPEDRKETICNNINPAASAAVPPDRGGFIEGVGNFDAGFFGISSVEASSMDPQHRKFLETAWRAIEDSGYAPSSLSGKKVGVFAGVMASDYNELVVENAPKINAYSAAGLIHTMLANRLSYFLNIHGPSETVNTACSSSLVAVHRAVQAICNKECDQAIAGGVSLLLSSANHNMVVTADVLSHDGKCKTFDASADGYVRGEGVGVVILKPVNRAIEDNDQIYGVIKGSAVNHGGRSISLTAPNENAQASLIVDAIEKAGVPQDTITYIETHGTGTSLGDPIEVNGLKKAFSSFDHGNSRAMNYCGLGSVKTNIGHLEGAAGAAALVKTLLSIKHKKIPASINFKKLNPYIRLEDSPFYIVENTISWDRPADMYGNIIPLRAGVSSFGYGGTNAHIILEEYEGSDRKADEHSEPHAIVLSAKTPGSLDRYIRALNDFLNNGDGVYDKEELSLSDIAFTLQTGRDHFPERAAFIVQGIDQLKTILENYNSGKTDAAGIFTGHSVRKRSGQTDKIKHLLMEKDLSALIRLWLEGVEVNWKALHDIKKRKRISLPTYRFEETYYWIEKAEKKTGIDFISDQKDSAALPVTLETVVDWLKRAISEYSGMSLSVIDTKECFSDYGLDSIALIDMLNRIKKDFCIELSETAIQDCPNIISLANFMVNGEIQEVPDLEQEAVLDEAVLPINTAESTDFKENNRSRHVLVTGATGFFGTFLLRELINRTDAEIYCLVRAADPDEGIKRLRAAMEKFMITDCSIDNRVTALAGDLTEEKFGIDTALYDNLSRTIDTVYHCGAVVDWMKSYAALKKVNVSGTAEVIRFAGNKTVKHLHYISSLSVLSMTENKYQWFESDVSRPDNLTNGYAQSKWVAETLCMTARERGLPVNIYRFDFVVGTEKTGAMKETDFIIRLIKGCIQLGCIPAEETNLDIVSVDYLAQTVFDISKSNENKTYHLINRHPFTTSDFASLIRKFGYKLEKIPFEAWKNLIEKSPSNVLYPLYPFLKQYSTEQLAYYLNSTIDNTNTLTALYKVDPDLVSASPPAGDIMHQVISFFQQQKYLPPCFDERILLRQKNYWRSQFAGASMRLDLPKETWVKKTGASKIASEFFPLDSGLFERIKTLSDQMGISIPEVLLAAYKIFLFRYCRETDIPVAVPVAQAVRVHTDDKKGYITKVPIIRTILPEHASFRTVLMEVKQNVSEAYANLALPSDEICNMIYSQADSSDKPIYDCMFIYRDDTDPFSLNERMNIAPLSGEVASIQFDGIVLRFDKPEESLTGSIEYDPNQFSQEIIIRMVRHYNKLLHEVITDPDSNVFKVPIMEREELDRILYKWNDTKMDYPSDKCVHELFSLQAERNPDAIAVSFEGKYMTYKELDEKSDQLAIYLQKYDIHPGDGVGVCIERSFNMVISVFGILKSGAAYVPLDPEYPADRLKFMVEDSGIKIIITQSDNSTRLSEMFGLKLLCMDKNQDDIFWGKYLGNGDDFVNHNNSLNPAYIIYTSGSTGTPKGVRILHRSIINLIYSLNHHLKLSEEDICLASASLCFDASVIELFVPLTMGAQVKLLPLGVEKIGEKLKCFLDDHKISMMFGTPTTWQMLKLAQWQGSSGMTLLTGGEAVTEDLAHTLIDWGKVVYNIYGPTEITVCSTIKELKKNESVTLGRPFFNTQIYILDNYQNPLPIGVEGELCIGGDCLAEGYHNFKELTERSFVMNPFGNGSERIYRTGDLVRYLPDGDIDYFGRLDNQIKINGYRVELAEIRNIVEQDDQTGECEVILREDRKDDKRIIVYIIPKNDSKYINVAKIHKIINEKLPRFMIPSAYVVMDKFPSTPSGKIDINAFPVPHNYQPVNEYIAPSTVLEIQLAEIWQQVLNIEKIGINDNFLEIGGNSITSIKLLTEMRDRMDIDIKVQHFYENLTIAELAETIDKAYHNGCLEIESKNIVADLIRDASIQIQYGAMKDRTVPDSPNELKNIFLTGVTGFLGAYLLEKILEKTQADVFCLVRADNSFDALKRIKKNLESYSLWKPYYNTRIKPVVGDLSVCRLGLAEEDSEFLAAEIDAIYHCGSIVNFFYPYQFLKKANVDGTIEVLKLAGRVKIKPVFHISTIGVFESIQKTDNCLIREDDDLPDPSGLFYGYSQSKWVAEKIVENASKKGLPVTIFRPGEILGDSRTGASNIRDIYNSMIRAFVTSGAMPDLSFRLHGIPVDYVADTIVNLSLNPKSIGEKFNIVSPYPVSASRIRELFNSSGYRLSLLPFDNWVKTLESVAESDVYLSSLLPIVRNDAAQVNSKTYLEMQSEINPSYSVTNVEKFFTDFVKFCPILDEKLLVNYLNFLEKNEFISKIDNQVSTWS